MKKEVIVIFILVALILTPVVSAGFFDDLRDFFRGLFGRDVGFSPDVCEGADIYPVGNPDGIVDANDLSLVRSNFGCSGVCEGDINNDGNVDALDLSIVRSNFGKSNCGVIVECVNDVDCDDGLYCNGQEVCNAGVCESGQEILCDDDVDCTSESCNEDTDSCAISNVQDGVSCNNGQGTCEAGVCVVPVSISCDDADLNNDFIVDANDLSLVRSNFGCSGVCEGDINNDGNVDANDLSAVRTHFGEKCRFDLEISVATLKDSYSIGEVIQLTDPPDVVQITSSIIASDFVENEVNAYIRGFGNIENDAARTEASIFSEEEVIIDGQEKVPEYNGYIVQFEEEATLERKARLEEDIKDASFFGCINQKPCSLLNTFRKAGLEDLPTYREGIKQDRARILEDASFKLGKTITGNAIGDTGEIELINEFIDVFNGVSLNISDEEAQKLKEVPGVKEVYPNYEVHATLMDSVPLINADDVWLLDANGNDCVTSGQECLTGEEVTIAIIDTGVDYTHPDLGGCARTNDINDGSCNKVIGGYDFVNNDIDPMDDQGHGTHVAGIAAGKGLLKGVAPDAKLYAYKVLDASGSGYSDDIIIAIEGSQDPNQDGDFSDRIDIISLSLGSYGNPDDPKSQAIDNAVDNGVVAVIAAGNYGPSEETIESPGTARKAITVGATYKKDYVGNYWLDTNPKVDQITSFSSRGPVIWRNEILIKPDIVAPGAIICSAQSSQDIIWQKAMDKYGKDVHCIDDNHIEISGTSMATPMVSGAVALIKQAHPDWTPEEIKMALRNTAIDVDENIVAQGYGRIDVLQGALTDKPNIAELNIYPYLAKGIIDIGGTAAGATFNSYELYYGQGKNPQEWTQFYQSSIPVINGILKKDFDSTTIIDGEYTIKLVVIAISGKRIESKSYIKIENNKITYPIYGDTKKKGDIIEIRGFAENNYQIQYTRGKIVSGELDQPSLQWSSEGIVLENGGSGPVLNEELLAKWDTRNIQFADWYTLRITIVGEGSRYIPVYLDSELREGWPVRVFSNVDSGAVYPFFGDLDGDGIKEIVFSLSDSGSYDKPSRAGVYAFRADGSLLSSAWPLKLYVSPYSSMSYSYVLAVEDIDNDGKDDIIFKTRNNKVYVVNYLGNSLPGWPKIVRNIWDTVLVSNLITEDHTPSIIFSSQLDEGERITPQINIVDGLGNNLPGWPISFDMSTPIMAGVDSFYKMAVADLNNDGKGEIIAGILYDIDIGDPSVIGDEQHGTALYIIDSSGKVISGWPLYFSGKITDIVVADIDSDGIRELIFGLDDTIHIFEMNGEGSSFRPDNLNGGVISLISLGDFDADGIPEITLYSSISARYHTGSIIEKISVYKPSGSKVFEINRFAYSLPGSNTLWFWYINRFGGASYPILVDIDSDEKSEIIIVNPSTMPLDRDDYVGLLMFDDNGVLIGYRPMLWGKNYLVQIPAVGDIDNDGKLEIVATSGGWDEETRAHYTNIYVWGTEPNLPSLEHSWPMFQHDPQHTGCYNCDKIIEPARPQSKIVNNEDAEVNGNLVFRIEALDEGYSEEVYNQQITIGSGEVVKLDLIFNQLGVSLESIGDYRVVVRFEDANGNALKDLQGNNLEASWEFSVI